MANQNFHGILWVEAMGNPNPIIDVLRHFILLDCLMYPNLNPENLIFIANKATKKMDKAWMNNYLNKFASYIDHPEWKGRLKYITVPKEKRFTGKEDFEAELHRLSNTVFKPPPKVSKMTILKRV